MPEIEKLQRVAHMASLLRCPFQPPTAQRRRGRRCGSYITHLGSNGEEAVFGCEEHIVALAKQAAYHPGLKLEHLEPWRLAKKDEEAGPAFEPVGPVTTYLDGLLIDPRVSNVTPCTREAAAELAVLKHQMARAQKEAVRALRMYAEERDRCSRAQQVLAATVACADDWAASGESLEKWVEHARNRHLRRSRPSRCERAKPSPNARCSRCGEELLDDFHDCEGRGEGMGTPDDAPYVEERLGDAGAAVAERTSPTSGQTPCAVPSPTPPPPEGYATWLDAFVMKDATTREGRAARAELEALRADLFTTLTLHDELSALHTQHERVKADADDARASLDAEWARAKEARAKLASLQEAHDELDGHYKRALQEVEDLKADLERAEADRRRPESPDDLRAEGWAVAVHNDYVLDGVPHTFWGFTRDGRFVNGEGRTDADALNAAREAARKVQGRGSDAAPQEHAPGLDTQAPAPTYVVTDLQERIASLGRGQAVPGNRVGGASAKASRFFSTQPAPAPSPDDLTLARDVAEVRRTAEYQIGLTALQRDALQRVATVAESKALDPQGGNLKQHAERYRSALERLASTETFTSAMDVDWLRRNGTGFEQPLAKELLSRLAYANDALMDLSGGDQAPAPSDRFTDAWWAVWLNSLRDAIKRRLPPNESVLDDCQAMWKRQREYAAEIDALGSRVDYYEDTVCLPGRSIRLESGATTGDIQPDRVGALVRKLETLAPLAKVAGARAEGRGCESEDDVSPCTESRDLDHYCDACLLGSIAEAVER